jgi:hypothetical protein
MHRAPVLCAAAACLRGASERSWNGRIDDVDNGRARRESLRIDRHGITRFHAKRRGIDDDLESLRIGWP